MLRIKRLSSNFSCHLISVGLTIIFFIQKLTFEVLSNTLLTKKWAKSTNKGQSSELELNYKRPNMFTKPASDGQMDRLIKVLHCQITICPIGGCDIYTCRTQYIYIYTIYLCKYKPNRLLIDICLDRMPWKVWIMCGRNLVVLSLFQRIQSK